MMWICTGTVARKARQKDDAKSIPTMKRAGIRLGGFVRRGEVQRKHQDKQRGHSPSPSGVQ